MDAQEYEQRQTRLQAATSDWILRGEPNAFVTFTFSAEGGVTYRRAEKIFGIFMHELKCLMFGKKSKRLIHTVPVIEGYAKEQRYTASEAQREETHIHCLFHFPGEPADYKKIVQWLWVRSSGVCGNPDVYCPDSDDWFLELDTVERKRIYTNYALKTCGQDSEAVLWKFVPFGA